ncbi:MAG TPA: PAS domain-containing protein, partial [Gallionella sp.]|nr:PAS domain-containing protein [Gallionella sp.]
MLLSGTLAIALWPLVNRTVLLAWLLSLWLVMAVCDVYLRRYLRQAREGIVDHEQWRTGMQVGAAITGLCWGISVLSIPASPTEPASMLMLFVLAGVTAFSGISMAAVPQAARAFLLPALLPVAFWLFSFGERLAFFMGMMTLGHLGLMLLFSRQPYRTIHGAEETRMWQLERKGMEDALATRERDFRSLAENLPDNIVRWDTQGRYMYINPVHERTLGISASDIIGAELPDSHEHVRAAIAQVVATGQVVELVRQPVLVDGELQIHEVSLAPECDADGRIVSVLCVGRDMTEAYRMQDALQEKFDRINELNDYLEVSARNLEEQATELEASQEQLKDALEFTQGVINAIPDSLFEVNRDGRYLNVWTQKPELLPAQKEVLLGKTIHEVLSPESAAIAMDSLREAEETGLSFGKVIRIDLPQGESWFEISASMKPGGTPSDTRFLVLSRDVTERRVMEAAREATLAEALRLAQLRSAFMAQMSHELRTPLNGILGYAQNLLMQSDALGEKQITGLRIIQNSGEHLLTLINGILDHAAIEADKFELFPGDIELEIFLGTIIGIIRVRAEQKNIAFNCAADAGLPAVVRGDAQRLRQVLLNLLANAVKFTDFGQVTLRVSYTA